MKTILIPTERQESMKAALHTALLLARRFDSYIEGFALQAGLRDMVTVDMGGGLPLDSFKQDSIEEANKTKQMFEAFMQEHGVPRASQASSKLSFGWMDDAPDGEGAVGSCGRVFDVIVLRRLDDGSTGLHHRALESGLFESGRPILLSPPTPPRQIGTNIMVHWNCSTEQARATAFAMPLLHKAQRVIVLNVVGGQSVLGPSAEQLLAYLKRNGVAAESMSVELEGRSTGEAVLASAKSQDCDLLIKGAYTQSRLRQWIFGGATRHILANAMLPVLMAH